MAIQVNWRYGCRTTILPGRGITMPRQDCMPIGANRMITIGM